MRGDHPFDPEKYKIADGPGKKALAIHLAREGKLIVDAGENYHYDLLEITEGGTPAMYHEVEVRTKWYGHPWRFPDISIVSRKMRMLSGNFHPVRFWTLSPDLKEAYYVDEDNVCGCKVVHRWAEGSTKGFLPVPTECWTYVLLQGGTCV